MVLLHIKTRFSLSEPFFSQWIWFTFFLSRRNWVNLILLWVLIFSVGLIKDTVCVFLLKYGKEYCPFALPFVIEYNSVVHKSIGLLVCRVGIRFWKKKFCFLLYKWFFSLQRFWDHQCRVGTIIVINTGNVIVGICIVINIGNLSLLGPALSLLLSICHCWDNHCQ